MLTALPYRLQNSWEEIFDVLIPWHRVYELIYKTTQDTRLRAFQLQLLYRILATNKMLNIGGIESSQLCRFCYEDNRINRPFVLVLPSGILFLVYPFFPLTSPTIPK